MRECNVEITIFKAITTEDVLVELETEAKSYEGLYVDMENKPERKYVKDKAALISGMLKKLDRARIDEAKSYKVKVETEADSIKQRLEAANLPFTALIDDHKKKRAEELAEEKRIEDLKALAIQIEQDHETAIMEGKVRAIEKKEAEAERVARDEAIKKEALEGAEERQRLAVENARLEEIRLQERNKKAEEDEKIAREADTEHKGAINRSIVAVLVEKGISEAQAKLVVKLAVNKKLPHITINY